MDNQRNINIDRTALYEWIVQSTDNAIISKDINGKIISWNKAAEKILGYSEAEVLNQHISIIVPSNLIKEEQDLTEKIKSNQLIDNFETKRIRRDGTVIDVSLTFSPIKDLHGNIVGASKILMDITAKLLEEERIRKLNQAIADNEQKFRAIIENNKDIISLTNENYDVIYRSPSSYEITGYTQEEIEERVRQGKVVNQVHPDDQLQMLEVIQKVKESPGIPIPVNFRSLHKDGHYLWMDGTITNHLANPVLKSIVNNFRDITEKKSAELKLKRSEKLYREIASNIPGSVICLFDLQYRYTLVEGDLVEKLGFEKAKLLGKTLFEILEQKRLSEIIPLFQRVYRGESFSVEDKRGEYETLTRYVPLKEDGFIYGAMIVVFDVSELKKTQHELSLLNQHLELKIEERTAQLSATLKELEAFSYSVSHDLRAPLRGIDGWSLALQEDYGNQLDPKANEYIDRVRSEAQRMGILIDDLLKLSRLSKIEMKVEKVDLSAISHIICARLQEEYIGIEFEFKIKKGMEVEGDSKLIEIMMTNLISNACKFSSKKDKPVIDINCVEFENSKVFYVQDNGAGFNMQNAKNLFGAFQRMHRQSEFPGSGIGLAIVQRIINLHHGKIWAESTVGKGSKFNFMINNITDGK